MKMISIENPALVAFLQKYAILLTRVL